jgi:hypothetical protein
MTIDDLSAWHELDIPVAPERSDSRHRWCQTLMDRNNKIIDDLGDDSASEWQKTRTMTREQFTPGKFTALHSACFDHCGNIFVVEWVEIGRVTCPLWVRSLCSPAGVLRAEGLFPSAVHARSPR